MTDKQEQNIFDKIRANATEKQKAKIAEQQKWEEFKAKNRNEVNPLEQINKKLQGEKK